MENLSLHCLSYTFIEFITINDTGSNINLFSALQNQRQAIKFVAKIKQNVCNHHSAYGKKSKIEMREQIG